MKGQSLAALVNRTYHLCIEDRFAAHVLLVWQECYKEFPLTFRNAGKGVEGSFVVTIRDTEGDALRFIDRIRELTRSKVEVR